MTKPLITKRIAVAVVDKLQRNIGEELYKRFPHQEPAVIASIRYKEDKQILTIKCKLSISPKKNMLRDTWL